MNAPSHPGMAYLLRDKTFTYAYRLELMIDITGASTVFQVFQMIQESWQKQFLTRISRYFFLPGTGATTRTVYNESLPAATFLRLWLLALGKEGTSLRKEFSSTVVTPPFPLVRAGKWQGSETSTLTPWSHSKASCSSFFLVLREDVTAGSLTQLSRSVLYLLTRIRGNIHH